MVGAWYDGAPSAGATTHITRRALTRATLCIAAALAAACSKDATPPLVPTTLAASASSLTFDALGGTLAFTVTVRDQNGATMTNVSPTITSSSPAVATVAGTTSVTVTPVANGNATINVSAGNATTTVSVTVAQMPATITSYAGNNQTASVGATLPIAPAVRVADKNDFPAANVPVTFTTGSGSGSIAGSPATTNSQGVATAGNWTLGTTPGAKSVTATVSGINAAAFSATATVGPAAALAVNAGNNQTAGLSSAVTVAPSVKVIDQYSNPVPGVAVTFAVGLGGGSVTGATSTSNSAGVATVGSWVLGATAGSNTLVASAAGLGTLTFSANASLAPILITVSPAALVPGATMTITGTGFASATSSNIVRVGGATAAVTAANPTQLTATVPCALSGNAAVSVTAGGLTSNALSATVTGTVRTLATGQFFIASNSATSLCNELAASSGPARYLVSVYSTSTSANSLIDYELGGNPAAVASASLRTVAPLRASRAAMAAESEETRRDRMHWEHLERDRARGEALRAAMRASEATAGRTKAVTAAAAAPVLGDRRVFHWSWTSCNDTLQTITARVLYAGTKAIIWEDTTNAQLAGANSLLADRYQRIGQVFDADQYDVVRTNFSDPLLRDPVTDNDGRVHMIFTHRVNDIGGVAAFVTSADQFPRTTCASSNFGEFFYGSVPTASGSNVESTAFADGWFNFMNRTVVHEVKHIASVAARVKSNAPYETGWLEEGTARHAEEVWARQSLHHSAFRGNNGYGSAASNGLFCDFNASNATCLANDVLRRPSYGARRQFNEIRPKLLEPWNWSPFGDGSAQSGSVFYQTVWSLVRYAVDLYGSSDAAFLTALTNSSATGTSNLATLTGVPFEQLLGGWSLALYADDYPGLAGASPVLQFQTWNLRNIYGALNTDPAWSSRWATAYPIAPTALTFGAFTAQQTGLRGGANAYYEISGPSLGAQLLNLRALGGGNASGLLRIAIVRLQ